MLYTKTKVKEELSKKNYNVINMVGEYIGYEPINAYIDRYNLFFKNVNTGEVLGLEYKRPARSLHINKYIKDEKSSVFLKKGDLVILDSVNLDNNTFSWMNVLSNSGKEPTDFISTYARFKVGERVDEETGVKDEFYVAELLGKEQIVYRTFYKNNIAEMYRIISKFMIQETKKQHPDRIYFLINGLAKLYPVMETIETTEEGGTKTLVCDDIEKVAQRLHEYNGNILNMLFKNEDLDLSIRAVKQYFSGNQFKRKLQVEYKKKKDLLLLHFPQQEQNVFKLCNIALRKRKNNDTRYFMYFDTYNRSLKNEDVDVIYVS